MKIAVNYENGQVFQHFGKTREFKIYEVENGQVVSESMLECGSTGHEALAGLLAEHDVDTVLCGGLGGGMSAALEAAGIKVISGVTGAADTAVAAFLEGDLKSAGINCDHHDHEHGHEEGHHCGHHDHDGEDHHCGHHDHGDEDGGCCGHHDSDSEDGGCCGNGEAEEGCGHGCGGCGGGCHGPRPVILEGRNAGKTVRAHYTGTFNDGTKFDSSYDRGEPIEFVSGTGMMIAGFDKAVVDMEVGETRTIHLMPEEAYGERNEEAIIHAKIEELPGSETLNVGDHIHLRNIYGQAFPVVVTEKTETDITFDANHEMAGKELNFEITLVSVDEAE